MKRSLLALALLVSAAPTLAQQSIATLPPPVLVDPKIAALRENALNNDDYAWDITEGLTTEVGQRLAATEAEVRARNWAVKRLTAMGFSNVHVEPFTMPVWTRSAESAEIVSPFPQRLAVAALGYSGSTGPAGVTGEIVYFDSVDALRSAPDSAVRGKIVFIDHHMMPAQDGSGYGQFGAPRRQGPTIASKKGALAIVSARSARTITATRTRACNISRTVRRLFLPARLLCRTLSSSSVSSSAVSQSSCA
jgi:hypothetical protein